MSELTYLRQLDWFDPSQTDASVTVVGAGGIGSFTALALAKLGVQEITLVDFDRVEGHNLPNQLFAMDQLGEPKVEAVASSVRAYTGTEPRALDQRLQDGLPVSEVVVSALDSMAGRAALWEALRGELGCKRLVDGRLAGENVVVYSAAPHDPEDVEGYEATLHPDDEGIEMPCTRRSIIDVGFAVASLITRAVRRHYAGAEVERTVVLDQEALSLVAGGWPPREDD